MKIEKYHGLGNDFVIVDYFDVKWWDFADLAITLCDRHSGVGADGLIIVKQDPLEMIFYNQDGSRAKMCGNGIRCFANFVYRNKITLEQTYEVQTLAGVVVVEVVDLENFMVRINMGKPNFKTKAIPMCIDRENFINETILVGNKELVVSSLFMGATHTVIIVDELEQIDVEKVGYEICHHELYPDRTNANFVQVIDEKTVRVITYERGVGITLACGTGCCASALIANKLGFVSKEVVVQLELGNLVIDIEEDIFMMGAAKFVFKGEFNDEV